MFSVLTPRQTLCVLFLAGYSSAVAQEKSPLVIDGLIDGYYTWNAAHPFTGQNAFELFDVNANAWSLSLARAAIDQEPGPLGFHLEVGAGKTYTLMHSFDRGPRALHYLPQAYAKWKPAKLRRVEMDFGKFYTSTGIEVLDTDQNWNYTRSLLFSWAQPAYHFGLRTTVELSPHFSSGFQLVNGWNNVADNNSGKTMGFLTTVSGKGVTWTNVYYAGPEKPGTNVGWRRLYDTSVMVTAGRRVSLYTNLDYGADPRIKGGRDQWLGIAGAGRVTLGPHFALASRVEWLSDRDGFLTGAPQWLKETTFTGEWKPLGYFTARLEFRRDWSEQAVMPQAGPNLFAKSQNTLTLGLLSKLSIKR